MVIARTVTSTMVEEEEVPGAQATEEVARTAKAVASAGTIAVQMIVPVVAGMVVSLLLLLQYLLYFIRLSMFKFYSVRIMIHGSLTYCDVYCLKFIQSV